MSLKRREIPLKSIEEIFRDANIEMHPTPPGEKSSFTVGSVAYDLESEEERSKLFDYIFSNN